MINKIKEYLKKNWDWCIVFTILLIMIFFGAQVNDLVYGHKEKYCGNYEELYIMWRNDSDKAFCVLNCGMERGCNNTNVIDPYYNGSENTCYCINGMTLDYNDPSYGDVNFYENFTFPTD